MLAHVRGGGLGLIAGPALEPHVGDALLGAQQGRVVVQGGDLLLLGADRVDRVEVGGELLLEPAAFARVSGGGVDGDLLRVDRFGVPLLAGQVRGAAHRRCGWRDVPGAVGDADQRVAAGADPALVAGQALLDGGAQVRGVAVGELLGHQAGQLELRGRRGAEVRDRARVVQAADQPGAEEHDDAVVVAGADPAAHALLDALELAAHHRHRVVQRGGLDAVDAAVRFGEPVDDQDAARVVGQVDPVVLVDQGDQPVRPVLEPLDALAQVPRVQLVVGGARARTPRGWPTGR